MSAVSSRAGGHALDVDIDDVCRNTAILIRGELDVRTRCAAIINEVWKCFETQDGRCQSLEDVVAAAAIESSSIMVYIAKRLSQPDLDLITAR